MTFNYRGHKFKCICRGCGSPWFTNNPSFMGTCINDRCNGCDILTIPITDYDRDNIKRIKEDMARLSKEYDKHAEILKTLPWVGRGMI